MELVLSAIASGGLVGVADQYLCLLLVSGGSKLGLFSIPTELSFIESWWFFGLIAFFWVLTVLPAYISLWLPGVANTINTAINFLSGFLVPISSAILSLASIGIIIDLDPELSNFLNTLSIFKPDGGIGVIGLIIAGSAAVTGAVLTSGKALAKPAISTSTGTIGTVSAPIYATIENISSVIVVALIFFLSKINPWLLVALAGIVILLMVFLVVFSIKQLRKTKEGIGNIMNLFGRNPTAGFYILIEFIVWGVGWLLVGNLSRGIGMFFLWILFGFLSWGLIGINSVVPLLLICLIPILFMLFGIIGINSSRALMSHLVGQEKTSKNIDA
jgi:hypothetical protein